MGWLTGLEVNKIRSPDQEDLVRHGKTEDRQLSVSNRRSVLGVVLQSLVRSAARGMSSQNMEFL